MVLAVLAITAGGFRFTARLEEDAAPKTIAALRTLLPLRSQLVQARWSGESAWVPMGFELDLGLGPENANSYPAAGELLLYPGGLSEVEILFPYGATCFASKMGQLAGNHFATIVEGAEQLSRARARRPLGGRAADRLRRGTRPPRHRSSPRGHAGLAQHSGDEALRRRLARDAAAAALAAAAAGASGSRRPC